MSESPEEQTAPHVSTLRLQGCFLNAEPISKDARVRPSQHLNEVENRKRAWLFDLKQQGLQPYIEILETVTSDCEYLEDLENAGYADIPVVRDFRDELKDTGSSSSSGGTPREI
jgi:hypothetical protein